MLHFADSNFFLIQIFRHFVIFVSKYMEKMEKMSIILKVKKFVNGDVNAKLMEACSNGEIIRVEKLLKQGADPKYSILLSLLLIKLVPVSFINICFSWIHFIVICTAIVLFLLQGLKS